MRRAKIVCTLGPATDDAVMIDRMIAAGMNMARLNLSHGAREGHEKTFEMVRQAAAKADLSVAIVVDLQGPKIRLGKFKNGSHEIIKGAKFTITTEVIEGDENISSTTYLGLPGDCKVGDRILIDDGRVALEVTSVKAPRIETIVIEGGTVSNNKGLNLPGAAVSVPALSEKDEEDLKWAIGMGADFIALSFVRDAADIKRVHQIMDSAGVRIPVIAKIEKPQAVANLEEIVAAFDAIMVARGDLGVELPMEEVPLVQKRCITLARENAKPVIVATQMLDSMITNSRPTRAEVNDCANAVLDGADALMLSGETSVGKFPIETIEMMARIIAKTEEEDLDTVAPLRHNPHTTAGAITKAATEVGEVVGAKFLVAFTQSGDSARRMSRLRSAIPMLALTPDVRTSRVLALSWGVESIVIPPASHTDEMVKQIDSKLIESKRANIGDFILIVAGSPPGIPGSTNAMRVHRVGDAVAGVVPAYR
jgi:pyruvate kinase